MMEELLSSEMSVITRATQRNTPEEGILQLPVSTGEELSRYVRHAT
jgi:hypothetical protein